MTTQVDRTQTEFIGELCEQRRVRPSDHEQRRNHRAPGLLARKLHKDISRVRIVP